MQTCYQYSYSTRSGLTSYHNCSCLQFVFPLLSPSREEIESTFVPKTLMFTKLISSCLPFFTSSASFEQTILHSSTLPCIVHSVGVLNGPMTYTVVSASVNPGSLVCALLVPRPTYIPKNRVWSKGSYFLVCIVRSNQIAVNSHMIALECNYIIGPSTCIYAHAQRNLEHFSDVQPTSVAIPQPKHG